MELENIIKSLRSEIKFEKDCGNNLDNTDWGFEEGIIISANDLEKLLDVCEGNIVNSKPANCAIFGVIHWAFFPEQTPNYGDEILLVYPPEQMTKPIITIYDRNTEWIDGCKYAVITPCV